MAARVQLLLDAAAIIDSAAYGEEAILTELAAFVATRVADWCAIDVSDDAGGLQLATVAHRNPDQLALARRLCQELRPDADASVGPAAVFRSGAAELHASLPSDDGDRRADRPALPRFSALRIRSAMIVPLRARGQTLAVLSIGSAAPDRVYDALDLQVAKEIATRAAIALDSRRLCVALEGVHDHAAQDITRLRELHQRELAAREEAETAARRLKILADASRAFAEAKLDGGSVLEKIARTLVASLGDLCAIYLMGPRGALERAALWHPDAEVRALAEALMREPLPLPEGPGAEALRKGHLVCVEAVDLERAAKSYPQYAAFLRRIQVRSVLFVPLQAHHATIGALVMMRGGAARPFSEGDRALVEDLSHRAALAVEMARLYGLEQSARADVETWASWLAQLQTVTADLSGAVQPQQVIDVILTRARETFHADSSAVLLLGRDGKTLNLAGRRGGTATCGLPETIATDGASPLARVFATGKSLYVASDDEQPQSPEAWRHDVRSFVCVPLKGQRRSMGVVFAAYRHPHVFDDAERALLESIARQCAQALDRALAHEDLERRAWRDRMIIDAAEAFAHAYPDLGSLADAVSRLGADALGGTCVVRFISSDGRFADPLALSTPDPAGVPLGAAGPMSTEEPLTARVIATHEVAVVTLAASDDKQWFVIGSRLCAPLVSRGHVVGTITVSRRRSLAPFGAEDERTAAELAARASLAFENARLYEEARAAAEHAEEANRIKDEFLATVSHELRTPLNAILGWAQMLTPERLADAATAEKGIDVIRRNAHAQARLVEDILDVSRIITGQLKIDSKPADVAAIVRQAMDVVRPSADAKGLALALGRVDDPALLVGDPERLQQVVWNLLSNAVKFTDAGSVTVHVQQSGPEITIVVEDTGRGIERDFLPYAFERFRQVDSSTTRKHGGLGLGLAIVRHIVELHGGHVSVSSGGLDRGSTFRVVLPVRAVAPARLVSEQPKIGAASAACVGGDPPELRGARILVVDDDPDARELLCALLDGAGAVVEAVGSAAEAYDALPRFGPDVLVSDIGMPGEDGYSLIRKVRSLSEDSGGRVAAVALTAYVRREDRARALTAGYDSHVPKPVDPDVLLGIVGELAKRRQVAVERSGAARAAQESRKLSAPR